MSLFDLHWLPEATQGQLEGFINRWKPMSDKMVTAIDPTVKQAGFDAKEALVSVERQLEIVKKQPLYM